MFKRIKTILAKRKRLLIIVGASVLLLGAAGGGTALWLSSRMTPEKLFYESLALGPSDDAYMIEKSVGDKAGTAISEGILLEDGSVKGTGTLKCSASSLEYGGTEMNVTVQQFDGSVYLRYDELRYYDMVEKEWEAEQNAMYKNRVIGKWILFADEDAVVKADKEYGVNFELIGTTSDKLSAQEIADKMKESKAVTILNSRENTSDGTDVMEYNLLMRRSAYEKFMDSVESRYSEKDGVLDTMFLEDTVELTVAVDRKTKQVISMTYTMDNLCAAFISELDPDAAEELPKKMTITRTFSSKGTAEKLTEPTKQLTLEELNQIFYPEE
jgi:hypothetical protein